MKYPDYLAKLTYLLKRLPGVGSKSAERFAFDLIHWPKERLNELSSLLSTIKENLRICPECGGLIGKESCLFCEERRHATSQICLVSHLRDIFLIEETREYQGLYHVVSSHFHPTEGRTFHLKSIEKLKERIQKHSIQEVILAFDATEEGEAVALFVRRELAPLTIKITRLAFGLPIGSSFDFVDGSTLGRALAGRHLLK